MVQEKPLLQVPYPKSCLETDFCFGDSKEDGNYTTTAHISIIAEAAILLVTSAIHV
jgi:hypothetical protein